jgi:hypothetical protein
MSNPHSTYIDKRIDDLKKSKKWNTRITDTSHEDLISDLSTNICTNLIQKTFTKSYLKKHPCSDCKGQSKERCHGINEERPLLLKKALEKVYPERSMVVSLKDILVAFLDEHKATKFALKCSACHKAEVKVSVPV